MTTSLRADLPSAHADTAPRVRGPRRTPLFVAVLLVAVGSLTPWVDTAFGELRGLAGGGLWTLYATAFGLAAVVIRRPRLAAGHAVAMAVPAIALPLWQVARLVPLGGFGSGWMPGFGLVAVLGGGVIALRVARRLWVA